MALVVNKSGRSIFTQICDTVKGKRVVLKRFTFNPTELVSVDTADWKLLKKCNLMQKEIELGNIDVSSDAKKKAKELADEVVDLDTKAKNLAEEKG